jgi:maltose O-acetyltransferase
MRISVGDGCAVFLDCKFDTRGNCKIGRNSVINEGCRLDNRGGISIGDNVSLSSEVAILTASHIYDSAEFAGFMKSVEIRDRAWIGIRATIMPGVIIGKGAVVAAGSVVTRSVDEYTIVAGVPAKKIGMRNEKLSYQLSYKRLFH